MSANNGKGNNEKDNNTRGFDPFLWIDPEREQIKSTAQRKAEEQIPDFYKREPHLSIEDI